VDTPDCNPHPIPVYPKVKKAGVKVQYGRQAYSILAPPLTVVATAVSIKKCPQRRKRSPEYVT